ncbi:hypothetical protein BKA62DRAFT_675886 [Auriculariales sp. MPI-PUGE-AT-0066]|nr:hypothetical protein BKA62DRAFT_675886 [Auriculariales sp. MPI-PUGE-AT-0066]
MLQLPNELIISALDFLTDRRSIVHCLWVSRGLRLIVQAHPRLSFRCTFRGDNSTERIIQSEGAEDDAALEHARGVRFCTRLSALSAARMPTSLVVFVALDLKKYFKSNDLLWAQIAAAVRNAFRHGRVVELDVTCPAADGWFHHPKALAGVTRFHFRHQSLDINSLRWIASLCPVVQHVELFVQALKDPWTNRCLSIPFSLTRLSIHVESDWSHARAWASVLKDNAISLREVYLADFHHYLGFTSTTLDTLAARAIEVRIDISDENALELVDYSYLAISLDAAHDGRFMWMPHDGKIAAVEQGEDRISLVLVAAGNRQRWVPWEYPLYVAKELELTFGTGFAGVRKPRLIKLRLENVVLERPDAPYSAVLEPSHHSYKRDAALATDMQVVDDSDKDYDSDSTIHVHAIYDLPICRSYDSSTPFTSTATPVSQKQHDPERFRLYNSYRFCNGWSIHIRLEHSTTYYHCLTMQPLGRIISTIGSVLKLLSLPNYQ